MRTNSVVAVRSSSSPLSSLACCFSRCRPPRHLPCNNNSLLSYEEEEQVAVANEESSHAAIVVTRQPRRSTTTNNLCNNNTLDLGKKRKNNNNRRRTVLCYAEQEPQEGQVDLLPRSWGFADKQTAAENGEMSLADMAWKLCFLFVCCPLCYPCYVSRSLRRRGKIKEEKRWNAIHGHKVCVEKSLLNSAGNEMNRTLFRQVSEIKRKKKRATAVSVEEVSQQEEVEEEKGEASDVINVNVIILHSQSSLLLHKHISSAKFGASTNSLNSDCSDDAAAGDGVKWRTSNNSKPEQYLSVPNSSNNRLTLSPSSSSAPHRFSFSEEHSRQNSRRQQQQQHFSLELSAVKEDGEAAASDDEEEEKEFEDCTSLVLEVEDESGDVFDGVGGSSIRRGPMILQLRKPSLAMRGGGPSPSPSPTPSPSPAPGGGGGGGMAKMLRKFSMSKDRRRSSFTAAAGTVEVGGGSSTQVPQNDEVGDVSTALIDSSDPPVAAASAPKSSSVVRKNSSLLSRVSLRRKVGGGGSSRRPTRKVSSNGGSRLFYSIQQEDFSEDELDGGDGEHQDGDRVVQMRDLGHRTELVSDLGYQLSFSVYDEASVSEWKGKDLRLLSNEMPNMDLIVLAVRQNQTSELTAVLNTSSGMMGYFAKFWRGFYPLLLVELLKTTVSSSAEEEEEQQQQQEEDDPEFARQLSRLGQFFGDVHHIRIKESELSKEADWITECMARLFIHARLYQCSRFYGGGHRGEQQEQCPGGCELSTQRLRDHRKLSRKRPVRLRGAQRDVYRRSKVAMA